MFFWHQIENYGFLPTIGQNPQHYSITCTQPVIVNDFFKYESE